MNQFSWNGLFGTRSAPFKTLAADTLHQHELELEPDEAPDRSALMVTLDGINRRYGRSTVLLASAGLAGDKRAWAM